MAQETQRKNELQRLEDKLRKVEDKFLNEWINGTDKSNVERQLNTITQTLQKSKENVEELEKKFKECRLQSEANDKECFQCSEEISKAQKEQERFQFELEELKQKRQGDVKHKEETENIIKKKRKLKKQVTENKMVQSLKTLQFYQQRLGLQIKNVNGGSDIQFVFKYIDPDDWDRVFFFNISLDSDNTYQVIDCSPKIDDLTVLAEQLNNTNNLAAFVMEIRKDLKILSQNNSATIYACMHD